jgi:hypothetical protein
LAWIPPDEIIEVAARDGRVNSFAWQLRELDELRRISGSSITPAGSAGPAGLMAPSQATHSFVVDF